MKFGIVVNGGPFTHQASDSAYHFAMAALAKGHEIVRVFFYGDGVLNGTRHSAPPSDDRDVVGNWQNLALHHGVDLVICVAAGLRRGIVEDSLAPGFRISGLGQLIDAGIQADRMLVFGD